MKTTMPNREELINERKKTSTAYKGWRNAVGLRDAIIMEVGSNNTQYERAKKLVITWHERWQKEMDSIDTTASDYLMNALAQAEMECDAWTSDEGES